MRRFIKKLRCKLSWWLLPNDKKSEYTFYVDVYNYTIETKGFEFVNGMIQRHKQNKVIELRNIIH